VEGHVDARSTTQPATDHADRPQAPSAGQRDAAAEFGEQHQAPSDVAAATITATLPVRTDHAPDRRPMGTNGGPIHDPGPMASPAPDRPGALNGPRSGNGHGMGMGGACTAPQLRRFIKSRPYVPMHELRRRFAIDGGDDEVTAVDLTSGRIYVGLPSREGSLLGELLRGGEVGYELSLDPRSPIVIGLYPMRPVARG
jgi:hypothetical protein